jgi:pilus assembly protein CpaF
VKLSERLKQQPTRETQVQDESLPSSLRVVGDRGAQLSPTNPVNELKSRIQHDLFARLGARLFDAAMTEDQLRTLVIQEIGEIMDEEASPLSPIER